MTTIQTAATPARITAASQFSAQETSSPALYHTDESEPIILPITATMIDLVKIVARIRMEGHDGKRKSGEDHGSRLVNFRYEFAGALGEAVTVDFFQRSGLEIHDYTLLSNRPPTGADFTLAGRRFSVKTCPLDKDYLCVNERQRQDASHEFDFLLPVQIASRKALALFAPVPAAIVATWPLRMGRSAYRSIHIGELRPMYCLTEALR